MAERPTTEQRSEIAAVATGRAGQVAPYIGEISFDPRLPPTYRSGMRDHLSALQIYRGVLRDEQCMSTFDQRLAAAVAVPWEVVPGGDDAMDEAAADHLRMELEARGFDAVCRQMLYATWYGYAVCEFMWRVTDTVGIGDMIVRAPDRFRWSDSDELLLRTWANPRGEELPPRKFWVATRPGEHGDIPHGLGLARWCYWPVFMRRNGHRFWSVFLDKFGSPTPKGHYPPGDDNARARLLEVLTRVSQGAAVALPEGQDIELMQAIQASGGSFEAFAKYMDGIVAKVILGQSSTTEQGPWRGTAEVQLQVRDETIAADCRLLDSSINDGPVRWLTDWQFPGAAYPRVVRDASPPEDLDKRARREAIISGYSGLRPTRRHIETVYGGEWEERPAPAPAGGRADFAADPAIDIAIDEAIEQAIAGSGWEPLVEPVADPLLVAARRADSLEALRAELPSVFASMNDTHLVRSLERMGFTAALSGLAGLGEEPGG